MSAGITSQYGFLYQKHIFIMKVLENIGTDKFFVYEGIDDIEITRKDNIASLCISNNTFIQVKTGNINSNCWAKILGNWLLIDKENANFELITEKELDFKKDDEKIIKYVCEYFIDGKEKKANSIANRVYEKFIQNKNDAEAVIKKCISNIVSRINHTVISNNDVKNRIYNNFKLNYCNDIKISNIAKDYRTERFIEYMYIKINSAIEKKNNFTLNYSDFIKIIFYVESEINDEKFNINIAETKKQKKVEAEKFVKDDKLREIKQLKQVDSNTNFIIYELINELFYKDLRNVYSDNEILLSTIEENAFSNYEETKFTLPEQATANQIFKETVKKELPLTMVDNSTIYRQGCYIYLTGDEIDEEKQITWG